MMQKKTISEWNPGPWSDKFRGPQQDIGAYAPGPKGKLNHGLITATWATILYSMIILKLQILALKKNIYIWKLLQIL